MLLDTCAFIWLLQGGREFSTTVARQIEDPSIHLLVSAISACEIGIKEAKGDLTLPGTAFSEVWFEEAAEDLGIEVVEIDPQIAWNSTRLPWHHRDPFDRLIIATALDRKVSIVTPDRTFDLYDKVSRFW